jgi:ADP-heptose:LPS heptosyltransferase
MQLPALLDTDLETIPSMVPYIRVDDSWRAPWPERLTALQSPRIGFVWAGNPGHRNNRNRSLALEQLKPLTDIVKGHGVSLQKWNQKDEAALAASGLFDADPYLTDFTATAGLIMELDLVITVDTSVAHLAGALGKPVWVMIPFDPDWRWMIGREDSPWYHTLRLFRQSQPRDWDSVFIALAEELKTFLMGNVSVLHPHRWQAAPMRQNPHAVNLDG